MKTISEIARESGVSVQTIYRTLNKVKHETGESLTEKINGILHITEDGESLVKQKLNIKQENEKVFNQAENDEIVFLREQNKVLQDELLRERQHSRAQADRLAELATQVVELARNNQLLLGAEQSRTNPLLYNGELAATDAGQVSTLEPVKGFFKRFFNGK